MNETNYPLWSQLMEMHIAARNKAGYLTGETKTPAPEDPSHATWITENHRVKSWLIDSMSQSLMQRFIRLSTVKEIWEIVSKTFYDGSNKTRLFELNDNLSLPHKMVHGEILRKDPKLDLESTCAYTRREHQQKQTIRGHSKQRCYEIIGYLEWWDFSKKPRKKVAGKAMVASTEEVQPNAEENSQATANVAHPVSVGKENDILTQRILGYGVKRGKLYYLELTENTGQNFSHAYQTKSEEKARMDEFHNMVRTQYQRQVRVWQSDNAMEFVGNDPCEMKLLRDYLAAEFEMKDLGQLKYFLGIEIARSARGISLSQRNNVLDLLTETGMLACKPVQTPIEMNHRLGNFPNQALIDKGRY
ncbi:hypothetical protein RJ640_015602 [Escallonia rubra]|uniref:Uncharacterized protein n=1 Tax=Escallonia rubra TaxID=112253 RepID=A0AA88URI0_9ASTE|nr:hypothetical protein RJ640_015602 [Escallonia rubra]